MKGLSRLGQVGVLAAAALTLAALVHLLIVLIAPLVASRRAYDRLGPLGVVNATVLLPLAGPDQHQFPYADPAVAVAFCRFDLAAGPVRITAPTGRAFTSLSFHTKAGLPFYALTDRAATRGVIEAVLATPEDVRVLEAKDDEENPSHDLRVAAAAREGFVVMRVFSEAPSLLSSAEGQAKALSCRAEPIAP